MTNWKDHIPHWSVIRSMADIKLVKISYVWIIIVPILAKSLNKITEVLPITIGQVTIELNLALPFSWQLFFFSALTFTLAQFLYAIFCPDIIKKYKNINEFQDDGKSVIQLGSYLKNLLIDRKTKVYTKRNFYKEFVTEAELKNTTPESIANSYVAHLNNKSVEKIESQTPKAFEKQTDTLYNLSPERFKAIFEFTIKIFDDQKPILRLIILVLYLSGFLLSFCVLLQNVMSVIRTVI
ncbi:hypothetical protein [Pseudoalteromonas sp. B160]|uniref:hypothetical protein n=1 Tax=Pseudoalteromonas sp. B160 TaxID=630414 RepID=UPI00301BCCB2